MEAAENRSACVVLGGGGHARIVIECMVRMGLGLPQAVLDPDPALADSRVCEVPVRGADDQLATLIEEGVGRFFVGLGGVGDNGPRARLFESGLRAGLEPETVVAPSADVSPSVKLGVGTFVGPGAVVNAGADLGRNVIVNSGAIVEHDCHIEDHVHVASGAVLASTVKVGMAAHIGAGAVVRQGVTIGARALVGAGAVVVDSVAPGTRVVGVPARPIVPVPATGKPTP